MKGRHRIDWGRDWPIPFFGLLALAALLTVALWWAGAV